MAITKVPCSPRASASARLGSSRVDSKALPSAPAYAGALPFTTRWKARSGIWESCWYWVSCWQRSRSFCAIARSSRRPHLRQATTRVRCSPRASASARLGSSRVDSKALPNAPAARGHCPLQRDGKREAESGHPSGVGSSAGSGCALCALSCGATAAPISARLLRGSDAAQEPADGTAWRRGYTCRTAIACAVREITSAATARRYG